MRTIVTRFFPLGTGAGQAGLSALASTWAADGEVVTAFTACRTTPLGQSRRSTAARSGAVSGITSTWVVRSWLCAAPNEQVARRTIGHRKATGWHGRCNVEKYFDRRTQARQYRKLLGAPL
jgi:hypothetical protein